MLASSGPAATLAQTPLIPGESGKRRCQQRLLLLTWSAKSEHDGLPSGGTAGREKGERVNQQVGQPGQHGHSHDPAGGRRSIPASIGARAVLASMAVLLACSAGPASAADWAPNETPASFQADLIDYEFSQSRGLFAWNDCCGTLWLGRVDRATGRFIPADGKGVLVDPDTMTFQDAQKTKNGPEWVSMLGGDVIVYTKYSGRHTDGNSRIGLAYPMAPSSSCAYISSDGYWCAGDLGPEDVRKAPYGSKVDNDPAPRISYVDNRENHYWRELLNPGTEQPIPDFPASNYPIRLTACADPTIPGVRSAVYPVTIDGVQQAVWRDFDSGVVTQLTFDPGTKYEVWMWCAPEYGNELVFFTLVDQVELRVYRNLPVGPGGAPVWTPVYSQFAPPGNEIFSPEPVVYDGKSYIFMAQTVAPNRFRSQIWIANIDASAPLFKRITPLDPLVTRTDPEVFITDNGPYVYYNVLEPATRPNGSPKPCRNPSCSLGVWFADPGLKPTTP